MSKHKDEAIKKLQEKKDEILTNEFYRLAKIEEGFVNKLEDVRKQISELEQPENAKKFLAARLEDSNNGIYIYDGSTCATTTNVRF